MPEAAVAKAELDAHVEEEITRAQQEQGAVTMSIDEVKKLLGATDSISGVESTAADMTIYNRYDGVPSRITTDLAGQTLRVRFEKGHPMAGDLVWTTKAPAEAPKPGTLLCPLHPDSEERKYLDSLHFEGKTCKKSTMKTLYDRDMHFEKGHGNIYKAVEKDKDRQLQVQQMALMQEQTKAMQAMAAANGAQTGTTESTAQAVEEPSTDETRCDACQEVIEGELKDHSC